MSATGKTGTNFFSYLFPQEVLSRESSQNKVALFQKLRKKYPSKEISNELIIRILDYMNGNESDAVAQIEYFLYKPSETQMTEMRSIYRKQGIQFNEAKARNLLKFYKNTNTVEDVLKQSKYDGSPYSKLKEYIYSTTNNVNDATLKKYLLSGKNKDLEESLRFHVGIENRSSDYIFNENLCFINTSIQLLYHVPEFKDSILNFDLNNAAFKNEFASSKLEPLVGLKNIFSKIQTAEFNNQKSINIGINMNAYFECLWIGPYRVLGKKVETDEQYRKRLEIDLGMYKETDYQAGESEADRRRRIVSTKVSEGRTKGDLIKEYAQLDAKVTKLFNKKNNEDADLKHLPRQQHDIADFIENCIFTRLDKTSTRNLRKFFLFNVQISKDFYFKYKPSLTEGTRIGSFLKQEISADTSPDITFRVEFPSTRTDTQTFFLQNLISSNKAKIRDHFEAFDVFRGLDTKIKEAKLVIDKVNYTFPAEMGYLFVQLGRSGPLGKIENTVHINKILKIDNTYFECIGIGCQFGGADWGHYAYIHKESDGKWIVFNDDTVTPMSEANPESTFVHFTDLDINTDGYVFLYKKLTDYTEEQWGLYTEESDLELSAFETDEDLEVINTIYQNLSAEKIVEYSTKYEILKQATMSQVARNVERVISSSNVKSGNLRLYIELLRDKYPASNTRNASKVMRNKVLEKIAEMNDNVIINLLQRSGIINAEDVAYIRGKIDENKLAENTRKAANLKKAKEAENTLVSETKTKWEARELELRQKAAKKEFDSEDARKISADDTAIQNLRGEIIVELKTIEDIINQYKIKVVIQLLVLFRLLKKHKSKSKSKSDQILEKITTTENEILRHLRNIDKETGSTFIYEVLNLKEPNGGPPLFTLQELIQRPPGVPGVLANSYTSEDYNKNRNRATRVVGGARKKRGTQKNKRTSK